MASVHDILVFKVKQNVFVAIKFYNLFMFCIQNNIHRVSQRVGELELYSNVSLSREIKVAIVGQVGCQIKSVDRVPVGKVCSAQIGAFVFLLFSSPDELC